MIKLVLSLLSHVAEHNIAQSNHTACLGLSYQPKVPENIKDFKK